MKIKNSELKFPIILNLILICFLYCDYFLPSTTGTFEKFENFNSAVTMGPSWKGSNGVSISNTLECKNGDFFRIARIPTYAGNIKNGESIYIQKTLILSKIKYITYDNLNHEISILSYLEIIIGFSFCLIITLANVITDKLPNFLLGFGSMFIYFVSVGYLFYFS